jgi:hypothetical protein
MAGKPLCTREQLVQRVRHDFPADQVDNVLRQLDEIRSADWDEWPKLGVLRLANGRIDLLHTAIALAQADSRDLLLNLQRTYGHEWHRGFVPSKIEKWS